MAPRGSAEENRRLVADQLAAVARNTGGRLIKHAKYSCFLLAEGHLHWRLFGQMLRRIWSLPVRSG